MNRQQPRKLFIEIGDEEIKRTRQTAREAKEKAEKKVFLDAIDSIEIKDEDTKYLFKTVNDEKVEKTKRMAEEAGKRAEEEVYRKAFGISQADRGFSSYSAGAVLAVEADKKVKIEKGRLGQSVNHQVGEEERPTYLFDRLSDGEEEKNKCNQNISVKDFCPTSINPCMSRKTSNQGKDALTDEEIPKNSLKGEEQCFNEEDNLSAPTEKKVMKKEADSKELKSKKSENKEAGEDKTQIAHIITENAGLASANFSLQLVGTVDEITELADRCIMRKTYKFRISMRHRNYEAKVSANELEKFAWVRAATNGRAFCREKKDYAEFGVHIHEIIERDIENAEKMTVFKTPGWKTFADGQLGYVVDKGIIGTDIQNIWADTDLHFQTDVKRNILDSIKGFMGMQGICKKKEISCYLMTVVNKSVISTLFEKAGFPDKNITVLLGTTNTLKTSTALVFSKIFNAQETFSPELTFSSTQAGIETYVSKYADALLFVDDFMPASDRGKQSELNGKLELLCRLYGDRTSKKRMTVFSGRDVEYPVRGSCMITAEHLTGVESSKTRMTCLNFERGDVNKEILAFYQNNSLILPTYLGHFITFITQRVPQTISYIREKVPEYRKQMNFKIARYNETAAQLMVMVDVMFDYWGKSGFLSNAGEQKKVWQNDLLSIISKNDRQMERVDVVHLILQALVEEMQSNSLKVKPVDQITPSDATKIYFDDTFIYIPQNELYLLTKAFCKRYEIPFYLQPKMIAGKLKEQDVLSCLENAKGHMESARKLKQGRGITQRFLYLKKAKISEVLGDE